MRNFPARSAIALSALSLLLTGCIQDVVSPQVSMPASPGASPAAIGTIDNPAEVPITGGPGATTAASLKVGQEGTLKAGRFTLFLHKNALKKDATVSLRLVGPMDVEFTVTPPEANDFQVPARVTADLSDLPSLDVSTQTMFYWDGAWEIPNNVVTDTTAHTIMATMHELSSCRVAAQPQSEPEIVNHSAH